MIGGSKSAELDRNAKLIVEIFETQGLYLLLMFLVDMRYSTEDIKAIADRINSNKG